MSINRRSVLRRTVSVVLVLAAVQAAVAVAGRVRARRVDHGDAEDEEIRRTAMMNGVNLELTSQAFRRGRFDLVMGGANIDLTDARLAPEGATIEVHGAMGGLNLEVPEEWLVTVDSQSRTSGVNLTPPATCEPSADAPHLRVVSDAKMSGINVDQTKRR